MRIDGRSTTQICEALEIKPRTLYIWFSDPLVKQAFADQMREINETFAQKYAIACVAAIDAMTDLVNQPLDRPPTPDERIAACQALLDRHPATAAVAVKLRALASYAELLPPEYLHRALQAATGLPFTADEDTT